MILNANSTDLKQVLEMQHIFDRRNKIIVHNNYCILETIAFYDHIFLNNIIRPYLFTDKFDKNEKIKKFVVDRFSFMDKYKIIKEIAKEFNITLFSQKQFEIFINMRNKIAHNLSTVSTLDIETKENEIILGGEKTTWNNYLKDLNEWVNLSSKMARFIKEVFCQINDTEKFAVFMYCKLEGNCVLVQHNLIYPEPESEYTSFFKAGFNMDLLQYVKEELQYNKECKNDE